MIASFHPAVLGLAGLAGLMVSAPPADATAEPAPDAAVEPAPEEKDDAAGDDPSPDDDPGPDGDPGPDPDSADDGVHGATAGAESAPLPDLLEAHHEPSRVRREDERQPGDDDKIADAPEDTAKVADGEWYLPRAFDEGLADSGLDSWKGPYRAVEARLTMHRFFSGDLRGRMGGSVTAQLDVTPNFGIHAGVFYPGNLLIVGGQAFGNNRLRLADFRRIDASLGLVFPEISVSGVILFDPLEAVLKVQVQVLGVRMVFADLVHVSLRAGAPTVWASLPQLGTAFSWSGSLDVGLNF